MYWGPRGKIVMDEDEEALKRHLLNVLMPLSPRIKFSFYTQQFAVARAMPAPARYFSSELRQAYETNKGMVNAGSNVKRVAEGDDDPDDFNLAVRPGCPWCAGARHMDLIFVQSGMGACTACAAHLVTQLNYAGRLPNATKHIVPFDAQHMGLLKYDQVRDRSGKLKPLTGEERARGAIVLQRELLPAVRRAGGILGGIRTVVERYPPEDIADFRRSGLSLDEWRELQALTAHKTQAAAARKAEAEAEEEERRRREEEEAGAGGGARSRSTARRSTAR